MSKIKNLTELQHNLKSKELFLIFKSSFTLQEVEDYLDNNPPLIGIVAHITTKDGYLISRIV